MFWVFGTGVKGLVGAPVEQSRDRFNQHLTPQSRACSATKTAKVESCG